jgi:hypothetical protein
MKKRSCENFLYRLQERRLRAGLLRRPVLARARPAAGRGSTLRTAAFVPALGSARPEHFEAVTRHEPPAGCPFDTGATASEQR